MPRDHKEYTSKHVISKRQQDEGAMVKQVRDELERVLTEYDDKPLNTITTYMAAWMAKNGIVRDKFEEATHCSLSRFVQQTAAMMEF